MAIDITITLTAQQATRVQAAFKTYWKMDADPTIADIKEFLLRQLKDVVQRQERRAAETQIADAPFEPV